MLKITFMGAGSTVFARNVLGDVMCTPALRECEITENPPYRYREPEFEIRPEYRGAYKMYEKNPEMPDGRRFLGVAFYHHQYKKLVADKVFLRSEEL